MPKLQPDHDALLLAAADALAALIHAGEVDKQGAPIIDHCRAVAATLREQGHSAPVVAAGLLHDAGETGGHRVVDAIYVLFGDTTGRIVDRCTRRTAQEYLDHYIAWIAEEADSTAVKLADLEHNLRPDRPIPESLRKRYLLAVERLETVHASP